MPNRFQKPLRLPLHRNFVDVLSPVRHLLAILNADVVVLAIRVHGNTPEGAVFDLGNFEVDGFSAYFGGVADY